MFGGEDDVFESRGDTESVEDVVYEGGVVEDEMGGGRVGSSEEGVP